MTAEDKRRRFRDLGKTLPVKTARQLEAEQAQLELDFTPGRRLLTPKRAVPLKRSKPAVVEW